MEQTIKRRNILVCLILSIVTFGIYSIYWLYTLIDTTYKLTDANGNPALDIIFIIITFGFYGFYLWYKLSKLNAEFNQQYNINPANNTILYLVLYLFGLSFVNFMILQNDLNKVSDTINKTRYKSNNPNTSYNNTDINSDFNDTNNAPKFIVDDEKESSEDLYYAEEETITPEIYNVDNEQGFEQIYDEEEQSFDDIYDIDDDDKI